MVKFCLFCGKQKVQSFSKITFTWWCTVSIGNKNLDYFIMWMHVGVISYIFNWNDNPLFFSGIWKLYIVMVLYTNAIWWWINKTTICVVECFLFISSEQPYRNIFQQYFQCIRGKCFFQLNFTNTFHKSTNNQTWTLEYIETAKFHFGSLWMTNI